MKIAHDTILQAWFAALTAIQFQLLPYHEFIHSGRHVPKPRSTKPLSSKQRFHSKTEMLSCIPKCVPTLTTNTKALSDEEAKSIRALLTSLVTELEDVCPGITSDDVLVCLDSGCSIAATNDPSDFDGDIEMCQDTTLTGIASGLSIRGIGDATWKFKDPKGRSVAVPLRMLYVPDLPCRLLPPQQLATGDNMDSSNGAWIGGGTRAFAFVNDNIIHFPYGNESNLPLARLVPGCKKYKTFTSFCAKTQPELFKQDNLSREQRQLLVLHHRYGHKSINEIREWADKSLYGIPSNLGHKNKNLDNPVCSACQFGSMHRRSKNSQNSGALSKDLGPGDVVSADHMVAGTPGLIPFRSGKPSKRRYTHSTMWVDNFSKFIKSYLQETITAAATIESKHAFERFAKRFNRKIKHIHSDNGVFRSKAFLQDCQNNNQTWSFCGVGAHWQNGIVERYIGIITERARTMLLHAMSMWPEVITTEFWSYVWQHAVNIHNVTIRKGQTKNPYQLFTDEDPHFSLSDFHVFGAPCYVLDEAVREGKSQGKWLDRAYMGVYVGLSQEHSSKVALVYNPVTKLVSPQYHIFIDESFSSIGAQDKTSLAANLEHSLEVLFSTQAYNHKDEYEFPAVTYFDNSWFQGLETKKRPLEQQPIGEIGQVTATLGVADDTTPKSSGNSSRRVTQGLDTTAGQRPPQPQPHHPTLKEEFQRSELALLNATTADLTPDVSIQPSHNTTFEHDGPPGKRRRLDEGIEEIPYRDIQAQVARMQSVLSSITSSIPTRSSSPTSVMDLKPDLNWTDESEIDEFVSFSAKASNPDVLTRSEMLRANDSPNFLKSEPAEISGLNEADVFEFHRMNTLPSGAKLLNAIWSYRRKRRPDGTLLKHKSRICLDGSRQRLGVDYWNSYSPTVQWSTVRLVHTMATMLQLHSRQIDFVQAFTQADLHDDVYMRIPQGWRYEPITGELVQSTNPKYNDPEHYIKLKKNLYGGKQSSFNWFQHLKTGLIGLGFEQDKDDTCLFIREDCIALVYTDDCLVYGRDPTTIDTLVQDLRQAEFILEDQGDIQDFLGVRIDPLTNTEEVTDPNTGEIHTKSKHGYQMTQTGLIKSILEDVGLLPETGNKPKTKQEPMKKHPLPKKEDEPSFLKGNGTHKPTWSYRSLIGKLNFLAQNTRPDISFAVHACAKHSNNPSVAHGEAIKNICRYLYYTQDRGIHLFPDGTNTLDAWVDSDFMGAWTQEFAHLRETALSRTGFIVRYAGMPVVWASRQQTEICLSTTEAELIAISTCARTLIPLRRILKHISSKFTVPTLTSPLFNPKSTTSCNAYQTAEAYKSLKPSTVWEDNAGCLELVNNPGQYRPRTRHLSSKWWHFNDQVKSGTILVKKIASEDNDSDIFTKPLLGDQFIKLRRNIMGW